MNLIFAIVLSLFLLQSCSNQTPKGCPLMPLDTATISSEKLTKNYQKLLAKAIEHLEFSYAPYSRFHVSAALLTFDGDIVAANNVENAAYGSTICAERSAIFKANAEGKRKFRAVAITAKVRGENGELENISQPVAPCGACRQVLFEFAQLADHDMDVIMSNSDGSQVIVKKISELLPLAFGPKDLS